MDLSSLEDLRTAMRLAGIGPKKGLGQHFLVDKTSLLAMVEAGEVEEGDTVLEVGPGLGVMTKALTERAELVVAVEADRVLAELLRRDAPYNLEVINEDILQFDLMTLPKEYKVVANIPYYLTSKLFRLMLESLNPPKLMAVLIQQEVAERIVAEPGNMSILALSVQFYAEPKLLKPVEKHKFWPAPKVDSAILQVRRRSNPAFPADPARLFRLIKAGFGEKRKQLKNSLAGGLNCSVEVITQLLKEAKLGPTARAQELSLADWHKLYQAAIAKNLLG